MMEMDNRGALNLVCAIVKTAVRDWKSARRRLKRKPGNMDAERVVKDCERFFRSKHFENLTGMDGKEFLKRLKAQEERMHAM